MISHTRLAAKLTPKDIRTLFARATRVLRQPGLDVLLAPTTNSIGRILVVAARRVGNAPERNKVRRRLKSIFHEERLYQQLYDCIVIIKIGGAKLPFKDLKESLLKAYATINKAETS